MSVEYKIEVKPWMTKSFDESSNPMPLIIMYGVKHRETAKAVRMTLHGDLRESIYSRCMCCGRPIENKISQYFGVGPICGGHNYVSPFDTQEELDEAIKAYRQRLVSKVWTGWIPRSAIVAINDQSNIDFMLAQMPIVPAESDKASAQSANQQNAKPAAIPQNVIRARIAKPVELTDDFSVFLSFSYNFSTKEVIKSLRAKAWNNDSKEWEIEYRELDELKSKLPQYTFEISGEDLLPKKINYNYEFKTQPMAHQIEGVNYGLDHSRFLLADEQGVGKTKQIIDIACIRKMTFGFKHCLIICGVNSIKYNWLSEIVRHSNETGHILGSHISKRKNKKLIVGNNPERLADLEKLGHDPELDSHYFIIVNIEALRNMAVAAKIKELCDSQVIGMVAVDEIHRCRNLETQQGQGLLEIQPAYRIGMTGTPLINNPLDLYAILKWLGYQRYSFGQFKGHFCVFDEWGSVVGYKNINQLRDQLSAIMLRRTKEEVLDLPEKVYVDEYVELSAEQKAIYNKVIDGVVDDDIPASTDCILTTYLRLRQVSGGFGPFNYIQHNAKLDRLEQFVEEAIYSGRKVIIYSNWSEAVETIRNRLAQYNPVIYTGEIDERDRQPLVDKFQNDPEAKIIIGTVKALGTGLTLTAATEVIFFDEPYTNADKEQAIDRCHRFGTTSKITIRTLMSYGTYDEDVHDIVLGKKSLADTIVSRKENLKDMKVA